MSVPFLHGAEGGCSHPSGMRAGGWIPDFSILYSCGMCGFSRLFQRDALGWDEQSDEACGSPKLGIKHGKKPPRSDFHPQPEWEFCISEFLMDWELRGPAGVQG